jgi:hypothetical protein
VIDSCIWLRPATRVDLLALSEQVTEGLKNAEKRCGAEVKKRRHDINNRIQTGEDKWAEQGKGKKYCPKEEVSLYVTASLLLY